jgi:hypothetical protein
MVNSCVPFAACVETRATMLAILSAISEPERRQLLWSSQSTPSTGAGAL